MSPKKNHGARASPRAERENEECCGGAGCCGTVAVKTAGVGPGGCEVEAVVSVDARGQMVLPKELRQKAGIGPDTKLAVVAWRQGETLCCLTLHKVDELAETVRKTFGPMLTEILRS